MQYLFYTFPFAGKWAVVWPVASCSAQSWDFPAFAVGAREEGVGRIIVEATLLRVPRKFRALYTFGNLTRNHAFAHIGGPSEVGGGRLACQTAVHEFMVVAGPLRHFWHRDLLTVKRERERIYRTMRLENPPLLALHDLAFVRTLPVWLLPVFDSLSGSRDGKRLSMHKHR